MSKIKIKPEVPYPVAFCIKNYDDDNYFVLEYGAAEKVKVKK